MLSTITLFLTPLMHPLMELATLVTEEERAAFEDTASQEDGKRKLFVLQLEGVDGPGNLFTPLGRFIFSKDMIMRLKRRLRFAKYISMRSKGNLKFVKSPDPTKSSIEKQTPIVIVGLPRTGSTMISRLLSADRNSRSPLYWEFCHDSEDASPAMPGHVESDPRSAPVDAGFSRLSIFSPNGLAEFFKFHKVGANEHEEITGFSRRYFYDMETALLSPAGQKARLEWQNSPEIDRSFLSTHLRVWLRLQRAASEDEFWVLKSPAYTAWLPELAKAFPNARFVFTSRDPKSVVPSLCGLNEIALSLKFNYNNGEGLKPMGEVRSCDERSDELST